MNILVTGGSGYIGTHTIIELMGAGHDVVVVDNYSNSEPEAIKRVEKIVKKQITFYELDVCNELALAEIFEKHNFDAVIHFAGLKSVGESIVSPLKYYQNNITSSLNLLACMEKYNTKQLVFSSSATVYGIAQEVPIKETAPIGLGITNPYGKTKYMIEEILMDVAATNKDWQITSLRYFNPIGAHDSGTIGEDPSDIPNNLMPYISQVAVGKLKQLSVFGNDYLTIDGTCIRDYIHVVDLAKAHLAAINKTAKNNTYRALNIGTGKGTSVMQLIATFQNVNSVSVPYIIAPRRSGDVVECYADSSLAKSEIGWQPEKTIEDACADTWRWQSSNPNGYKPNY